jgi:hypothetical protein
MSENSSELLDTYLLVRITKSEKKQLKTRSFREEKDMSKVVRELIQTYLVEAEP